jgi:uncharacterized membrane protein YcaP (DUF421 family)
MQSLLNALVLYLFLLVVFRLAGKRLLSQATTFDLVLVLMISETTQGAMLADDPSLANAMLLIATLVGAELVMSVVKHRWPAAERVLDGKPVVVVSEGQVLKERMDRERLDLSDILEAARQQRGLTEAADVRFAVLERDGSISIIPWRQRDRTSANPR